MLSPNNYRLSGATKWVCLEPTAWPDTCCTLRRIPVSLQWTNARSVIFSELIKKFCKLSCTVSNILHQFLIPRGDASTVFFCSRTSTKVLYPQKKKFFPVVIRRVHRVPFTSLKTSRKHEVLL